ncbi:DNA helicase [Rhodococcus phage Maselop]|nr:DNA helicase [Rhodococcus phage Braxoaddie]WNM64995.1 DNA helicase [Rhodococcus phage Maselop]
MAVTILADDPAQQECIDAIRSGMVYADLELDKQQLNVSWGSKHSQHQVAQEKLKSVGGKGITNGGGHLPLSLTNCRALRRLWADDLEISERLDDWAYEEIERLGNIDNLAEANSDAELSERFQVEAARIARVAHPYQRAGIAFCAATKRALLADQPGLGKTLQTLGTMVEADVEGDIIVFAPTAAVAITWPDELRTWLPDDEVLPIMGPGPKRHAKIEEALRTPRSTKRRWFIVNLEMARAKWIKAGKEFRLNKRSGKREWMNKPGWWEYSYPELIEQEWAAIVVDESHRCLIAHTAALQGQTLVRSGMAQLKLKEGGIKLALSGTPMRGKPENLWGTLNWLYPEVYSAYWNWVARWFVVWGDKSDKTIEGLDETKTGEFYQDIRPIMLRRTKKEVLKELPDKLYAGTPLPDENGWVDENSPVGHWVEMSPKQAKAYSDIQSQAETLLESGILVANGVLAELTRCKQFATCYGDLLEVPNREGDIDYKFEPKLPSAKYDWLVEFFDSLGINKDSVMEIEEDGEEEVRKVVVASQFTGILDLYERELNKKGIQTLKITGKVKDKDRVAAKTRWQQAGGPRVFLLNTQAGGVSLTLDSADDLVFLDETWIPDDQEQVEDRIHRASRLHQVTIHYLRSMGTVEENIALTTGSRERVTRKLLDEERGVPFAKKLLTPIKRPS